MQINLYFALVQLQFVIPGLAVTLYEAPVNMIDSSADDGIGVRRMKEGLEIDSVGKVKSNGDEPVNPVRRMKEKTQRNASPLAGCGSQHPAHRSDLASMTLLEVMQCYVVWHSATLHKWSKEPGNCVGRKAAIHRADRGLGDSGQSFLGHFFESLQSGDMIFWHFGEKTTVWEQAMLQPFDWNIKNNLKHFCLTESELERNIVLRKEPRPWRSWVIGKCVGCHEKTTLLDIPAPVEKSPLTFGAFFNFKQMYQFLYRPKPDVDRVVQDVLAQVRHGERLVGVHFRAQWFGAHHACGCLDTREAPKCMSNMGDFLRKRNVSGFESNTRVKYFVTSDELAGLQAFRETEAFKDRIVTLPSDLPLEHSTDVSANGAKRVFAEMLILSKASAILGTCGSTFSFSAMQSSGLPQQALILTGSPESLECAANHVALNYSAFKFARFAYDMPERAFALGETPNFTFDRDSGIVTSSQHKDVKAGLEIVKVDAKPYAASMLDHLSSRAGGGGLAQGSFTITFKDQYSWAEQCGCYGKDANTNEPRGGTCRYACKEKSPPRYCKANVAKASLLSLEAEKPAWVSQVRTKKGSTSEPK